MTADNLGADATVSIASWLDEYVGACVAQLPEFAALATGEISGDIDQTIVDSSTNETPTTRGDIA